MTDPKTNDPKPDLLCFSSSDWHGNWGSRQQVMMRLARQGYRVIFVERMAGLEHFWKYPDLRQRRWRRWREGPQEVEANLWLLSPPPLLPGRYYSTSVAWLNSAVVRLWLKPYLRQLRLDRPILWLYLPEHAPLIGHFSERLSVYHCIDEFSAGISGRKGRIIRTLEARVLRRVDIVFANSRLTFLNKRRLNPNTYLLPSGADIDHFARASDPDGEIPAEISELPRPILAYVGNINARIDIPLLIRLARARPQWTLVMAGQVEANTADLELLLSMTNVHWLGKRPFATLPDLLRGVDLCLIPYVQEEISRYLSPLKLYEYLATGKPIVSTTQPEVDAFEGLVQITSAANIVDTIEHVLQSDSAQDRLCRLAEASCHSWDVRVETITGILDRYGP